MKTKLLTLALAALTIGLLGSCEKNNGPETSKLPKGALSGEFTVNAEGKKVHFSKGNLTYNVSTATWAFYEHQYDCATGYDSNLISLFTWGYGTWSTSPKSNSYQTGDFTDWGSQIGDGNTWRTLSKYELTYLFYTRTVNGGQKEGHSFQRATINSDATGVYGMILYPDNYTETAKTLYTSAEWATAEGKGCVFLPAAGKHFVGSEVFHVGNHGYYWSSSAYLDNDAELVFFKSSSVNPVTTDSRWGGCSVRLVTDVN